MHVVRTNEPLSGRAEAERRPERLRAQRPRHAVHPRTARGERRPEPDRARVRRAGGAEDRERAAGTRADRSPARRRDAEAVAREVARGGRDPEPDDARLPEDAVAEVAARGAVARDRPLARRAGGRGRGERGQARSEEDGGLHATRIRRPRRCRKGRRPATPTLPASPGPPVFRRSSGRPGRSPQCFRPAAAIDPERAPTLRCAPRARARAA